MSNRIPAPNYTQLPNIILDNIQKLSLAELKLVMVICRQTFGWQRGKAYLSASTLSRMSGLSLNSVSNGLDALQCRQWIIREKKGISFEYSINVETFGEPPKPPQNLPPPSPKFGGEPPQNLGGLPPQNLGDLKESTEIKEKKIAGAAVAAEPSKSPKQSATKKEPKGHPDTKTFTDEWCARYRKRFGIAYAFNGSVDGKGVRDLLTIPDETWETVLRLAERAWNVPLGPKNFWCRQANSIGSLARKWNDIRLELDPPQAAPKDYSNW